MFNPIGIILAEQLEHLHEQGNALADLLTQ